MNKHTTFLTVENSWLPGGGGWGIVEIGEGINSPPILMSME